MRLYVPVTLDELASVVVTGSAARWALAPRAAHAVTRALVAELEDEDDESREYAAFLAAADDSLALVASRRGVPPVRVVVSLDVPDDAVSASLVDGPGEAEDDPAASAVAVIGEVPQAPVVAVHVDEPEAADDVRAVLAAADADDDDALDVALQRVTDRDLLWYDATEIPEIPHP